MRAPILATVLGAALSIVSAPVFADEVWQTAYGMIAWEADSGDTAILRLDDLENGRTVRLYVPGLAADVMGGRGAYTGVWIADQGADTCVTQMTGPDGYKSDQWGTFTITFVGTEFPSDWAGVFGACLDSQDLPISGVAQTG